MSMITMKDGTHTIYKLAQFVVLTAFVVFAIVSGHRFRDGPPLATPA